MSLNFEEKVKSLANDFVRDTQIYSIFPEEHCICCLNVCGLVFHLFTSLTEFIQIILQIFFKTKDVATKT